MRPYAKKIFFHGTVEIFKMAISKIQDFSAGSKFAIKLPQAISNESLLMTEKVKTVIKCFFSVTPL